MIQTCGCSGSPGYLQDGVATCPVCLRPEYTNLDYDCIPNSLPVLEIKARGDYNRIRRRLRSGVSAPKKPSVLALWGRGREVAEPISSAVRQLQKPKRKV